MSIHEARSRFAAMARGEDDGIDLLAGCLLVAQEEYPDLDLGAAILQVDALAGRLRQHIDGGSGFHNTIFAINHVLFEEMEFRGNVENYDDPDNCMLNRVLETRRGIPLSLSILYMEVGRRLGVDLRGVAFPGHFLVRYDDPTWGMTILDPFRKGRVLLRSDMLAMLRKVYGANAQWKDRYVAAACNRAILTRLLHNLKNMYLRRGDLERALTAVERVVILRPGAPTELRDRGLLYGMVGQRDAAIADLTEYLEREPDAADAQRIRRRLKELQRGRGFSGTA